MNSKQIALVGVSAVAIAVIFSATVMAGPPQSWLNVLIMNGQDEPVPVEILGDVMIGNAGPIAVEGTVIIGNADPIAVEGEVTAVIEGTVPVTVGNTVEVEGTVTIDNTEALPVTLEGTLPIDVSGWLHTNVYGAEIFKMSPGSQTIGIDIDTAGYRLITIIIEANETNCNYDIYHIIGDSTIGYGDIHDSWKPIGTSPYFTVAETFDVKTPRVVVMVQNHNAEWAEIEIYYYMTT